MTTQTIKQSRQVDDEIDLGKLFGIILDAKWLILCTVVLFSIVGVGVAILSTPIYKADALIQIESKSSGGISAMVGDMGELFSAESSATTEIEIIKSRMILGGTVDKFNLTTVASPNYMPIIGKGLARIQGEQISINVTRFNAPSYAVGIPLTLEVVDAEQKAFKLTEDNGSVVLEGKVGELLEKNGYQFLATELVAQTGDSFTVSKISKLDAINKLQENLSISERGKQTGIISLSFSGEDRTKIQAILNDIS
ncbi:Wzz/FepE/Etk N-terminal domain-containing protein, partial [Vibrio parahaemolyticus]|nr:Wzz/FepE/Etk N-terminal domain-containing protein [Vibrio parahaemolyticus]